VTRRPAPEPFVTSSWSQSSPPQVAGDVEAEHHAALHVLGDVAMGHPHAGASGVEQDVGGLADTDQHDVPRDQVGLGHHVAGQHQEPVGAVQVERGVHGGSIAVTNLVKIAALVADLAATS
jgi:hypothetical protein